MTQADLNMEKRTRRKQTLSIPVTDCHSVALHHITTQHAQLDYQDTVDVVKCVQPNWNIYLHVTDLSGIMYLNQVIDSCISKNRQKFEIKF